MIEDFVIGLLVLMFVSGVLLATFIFGTNVGHYAALEDARELGLSKRVLDQETGEVTWEWIVDKPKSEVNPS